MITIKNATLNFPSLFRLPVIKGKPADKYSTKVILDPKANAAELKAIRAEILRLRTEDLKGAKLPSDKICLRDGNDYDDEVYTDKFILSASSKRRPHVVHSVNGQLEPLSEDDNLIYSGCICNVNVNLWAQNNDYGKRINCELVAVQWKAEGTPIGGAGISREAAMEGFEPDPDDFG